MSKKPYDPNSVERFITWIGSIPSIIVHTSVFVVLALVTLSNVLPRDLVLLVWNTMVSLEAIYLAIFIQYSVNRNSASLREVEEDIDEIQEDVEELGEDVDEIQEDIEEISEDLEEIQEDVEEMSDDEEEKTTTRSLEQLTDDMRRILEELESLKKKK